MCAYWALAPDTGKTQPKENDPEDRELENLLGNYLITKYQLNRLADRISDRVGDGHPSSVFTFRHNDRWFKVNILIEKEEISKPPEEEDNVPIA